MKYIFIPFEYSIESIFCFTLLSGLLYGFSRVWSGTGTFIETLQNTGYGALPLTILTVLPIINAIFINSNVNIPQIVGLGIVVILDLLTILFILWSGYLWTYAME